MNASPSPSPEVTPDSARRVVLGISCFYHDAAAALLVDGRVIAAAHEERFTRVRHDQAFPARAIDYCLREAGLTPADIDCVGFYDKPLVKFERILTTAIHTWPRSYGAFMKALPVWLKEKLWTRSTIRRELDGFTGDVFFAEHHVSHAASAFYASPFEEAAILTVDGVGEWATSTWGVGRGNKVTLLKQIDFPHSLGLLYSAFTYFLGFRVNSAEYKVMGLAPYGEPRFRDLIFEHVVRLMDDGSFWLNLDYFDYVHGLRMTGKKMEELFGVPTRTAEGELEQVHKDIAASLQVVTEEIMLQMARHVHRETGLEYLCLAGGCALNCVANGRILREGPFKDIYVQPAAGDAGGALGVAYHIYHSLFDKPRSEPLPHSYWGPCYSEADIVATLAGYGVTKFQKLPDDELVTETARLIDEQAIVGWFQGRLEWGPRALGSRSIVADPRRAENRDRVNLAIKFRESFRPFAPTVLEEKIGEWFEIDRPSPYMLLVAQVRPEKRTVPAITHVDGSARIQSVNRSENPLYYALIEAFEARTGCPIVINTSFNVRGEPIVNTPEEAFLCFMRTNMDVLVLGSYLLHKRDMPKMPDLGDARELFALD